MKKTIVLLIAIVSVLALSACGSNKSADISRDTIKAGDYTLTKVTDYLYEVAFDDYEQYRKDADVFFKKYNPKIGGCSSVQNGKIRGRNYDWTFDEEPEFVVHVPANDEGRHASLGVAATTEITAADVETGKSYDIYKILPYLTLDGINDAGLTINTNVVGYEEMGEYVLKTETKKDDVCPLMVPRLILDRAANIDDALALIGEMDIFSLGEQEEAHFMISGPQSAADSTFNTVVVEFIPDENKHYQMNVIDYNKGGFVDDKPIMTNFHLTGFDGTLESATRHPMGYERYQTLYENFEQGSDVSGMLDLMKKVYFSRAYDLNIENFWYSDYCQGDLDMTMIGEKNLHGDLSKAGVYAQAIAPQIENYKNMQRDSSVWHTVHTSVYDIDKRELHVAPQEGGFAYTFSIEK